MIYDLFDLTDETILNESDRVDIKGCDMIEKTTDQVQEKLEFLYRQSRKAGLIVQMNKSPMNSDVCSYFTFQTPNIDRI